ncbi:cation channel sperm-associated protein 1-like [Scylla paramamosain]|uniref:cation channel sperm-associated protein 1-like n=1 Tax=Scylla paramamosain TaxID=85552 RepID=UPI0030827545
MNHTTPHRVHCTTVHHTTQEEATTLFLHTKLQASNNTNTLSSKFQNCHGDAYTSIIFRIWGGDYKLHCTTLHRTAPHHTTPHHTTPHYTIPYNTAPHHNASHCTHYTTSHITVLHHTTPHHNAPHLTPPHNTTLNQNAPHQTTQHHTAPHHSAPHYTTLHHTTLHHTTLYHTILPHTTPHHTELHHTIMQHTTPLYRRSTKTGAQGSKTHPHTFNMKYIQSAQRCFRRRPIHRHNDTIMPHSSHQLLDDSYRHSQLTAAPFQDAAYTSPHTKPSKHTRPSQNYRPRLQCATGPALMVPATAPMIVAAAASACGSPSEQTPTVSGPGRGAACSPPPIHPPGEETPTSPA